MNRRYFKVALFLFSVFLFPSCLNFSKSNESEVSPEEQVEPPSVPISGTNVRNSFTFANGRARCAFSEKGARRYDLACHAVIIDEKGNESRADSVAEGVAIVWELPRRIDGEEIVDLRCQLGAFNLSQTCDVTTSGIAGTRVQIDLRIADSNAHPPKHKTESDFVYLGISVKAYGVVPQIPLQFKRTDWEGQDSQNLGFQIQEHDPTGIFLSDFKSMCHAGKDKVFFSSGNSIFVLENGKVKLYAGSADPKNLNDFSHRLRVHLQSAFKLVCAQDGALFVGDIARILRIAADGTVSRVAGTGASAAGSSAVDGSHAPSTPLEIGYFALFGDNSLVFSEYTNSRTLLRKVDAAGILSTLATADQPSLEAGPGGSVLVLEPALHRIRQLTSSGALTTLAGLGSRGCAGDWVLASAVTVSGPSVAQTLPDGTIYFIESGCNRIRKIDVKGYISTVNIPHPFPWVGYGLSTRFLVVPEGYLISKWSGDSFQILRLSLSGNVIGSIGSTFRDYFSSNASEDSRKLRLSHVSGMVYAQDGSLVVVDKGAGVVRRVHSSGAAVTIAGRAGYNDQNSGDGGPPTAAVLAAPTDVALLSDGSVLVAVGDAIRQISSDGSVIRTFAGGPNATFEGNGRSALETDINTPLALAVTPDGSILFTEFGRHWVRRISPEGIVSVVAGTGSLGFSGDGGRATAATLFSPNGVSVDRDGSIIIADQNNGRVRRVSPGGIISTIAGNPGALASASGNGKALDTPMVPGRVVADSQGRIYVTDDNGYHSRILVLSPVRNSLGQTEYMSSIFFGTGPGKDCGSGVIETKAERGDVDERFRASLSAMCVGRLKTIAIRDNCFQPEGRLSIGFSQVFGGDSAVFTRNISNIVNADRPCSE